MAQLLLAALDAVVTSVDAIATVLGAAYHSGGANDVAFSVWDFLTVVLSL